MNKAAAFSSAMAVFEPFEPSPTLAVGVSGGPDSMALILLADEWAHARGGSVVGFTVDHGLRPDSGDEARQVGAWLGERAIQHYVLQWTGEKPAAGIQNAAREARYRLLAEACRERGILHLAVAHHAGDQGETVLFRRERGSGPEGLAGMSAARSLGAVRLIRPLLGWRKPALTETCIARAQAFFEDASNKSPRFARSSLRSRLKANPLLDLEIAAQASDMAARRAAGQWRLRRSLAGVVEMRPDGAALLDRAALSGLAAEDCSAVIAATLRTVGGNAFAPRATAVRRLADALAGGNFRGASLAGCAVRPWRGGILVCREPRGIAAPLELIPGQWVLWDDRFALRAESSEEEMTVGALGKMDFAALKKELRCGIPAILGAGLPTLWSGGKPVAVPFLGWAAHNAPVIELRLTPRWPLSSETFTVVNRERGIIFDAGA